MPGVRGGRIAKKSKKRGRRSALRMMAIMQDGNSEEVPKEFLEGGRTGRRNALPDVLQPSDAQATTADLPARLQQLATTVESTGFPISINDQILQQFLISGHPIRRPPSDPPSGPPSNPPSDPPSGCPSKQNVSTTVDPSENSELLSLLKPKPKRATTQLCKKMGEIIQLDSRTLLEMLESRDSTHTPHPQPGSSTQPEEKKDDAQKKEGS